MINNFEIINEIVLLRNFSEFKGFFSKIDNKKINLRIIHKIEVFFLKKGMLFNFVKLKFIYIRNCSLKFKCENDFFYQAYWLRIFFILNTITNIFHRNMKIDIFMFFSKYFCRFSDKKNAKLYLKHKINNKIFNNFKTYYIIFLSEVVLKNNIFTFRNSKKILIIAHELHNIKNIFYKKILFQWIKYSLLSSSPTKNNRLKFFLKTEDHQTLPNMMLTLLNHNYFKKKFFFALSTSTTKQKHYKSLFKMLKRNKQKKSFDFKFLFITIDYDFSYFKVFRNKKCKTKIIFEILNLFKKNTVFFLRTLTKLSKNVLVRKEIHYYYILIKKKINKKLHYNNDKKRNIPKNFKIDINYLLKIIELLYQKNKFLSFKKLVYYLFIYISEFYKKNKKQKKISFLIKNDFKTILRKILMNDIDKHMNNFNYIIRFFRFFKSFVSIEYCKIDNILIYNSIIYAEYKFSYNLIRKLCLRFSDSTKYWHYFSEIQKKIGFSLSKTLKYSLRILKKNPFTLPGIIFTGNLCSDFGSRGYAVSEYLQAYRYEKNSSLINLSISIQYLSSCLNRKNLFSDFSFIIAYSFFFRYINIRRYSIQYLKLKFYKNKLLKSEHHHNKSVFLDIAGLDKNSANELKKSIYILSRSRNFCLLKRKSIFDKFTNQR